MANDFLDMAEGWAERARLEADQERAKTFRRLETACRTAARNADRIEVVELALKEMRKFTRPVKP